MVDGDALEMRFGETQRGFESPPLRFLFIKLAFQLFRILLDWLNLYSRELNSPRLKLTPMKTFIPLHLYTQSQQTTLGCKFCIYTVLALRFNVEVTPQAPTATKLITVFGSGTDVLCRM